MKWLSHQFDIARQVMITMTRQVYDSRHEIGIQFDQFGELSRKKQENHAALGIGAEEHTPSTNLDSHEFNSHEFINTCQKPLTRAF